MQKVVFCRISALGQSCICNCTENSKKKHKIFACSSGLKDVKSNSSLKAVHAAFDLLGNEINSFLRGSPANHSDRQGLDKVAAKVFSEDGPDQ